MKIRNLGPSRWIVAFFAVFGLLLAACAESTSQTKPEDSVVIDDGKAPAAEQVLRLRLQGEPKTIDPHLTNQAHEVTLTRPLFAGLFTYNEQLDVVPSLATAMPTVANGGISEDGLTYTIKIKQDSMWSDGEPVTAKDFVYSMQRAMDPNLAGSYASFYYGITGAAAYNSALGTPDEPLTPSESELSALRDDLGVAATDDYTLVYQLSQPNPSFLNLLTLWTAFPVRQDIVEQFGDTWTEAETHVGNGAFTLSQWAHDEKMVLVPNPFWNGATPDLTRIEFFFIEDDVAAYQAYQAGEIDVVTVPPAAIQDVSKVGHPFFDQLTIEPDLATFALFMNNGMAPFDNQDVRAAFGTAIDRDAYVNGVLQGGGVPTTSWIPPGMPGYDATIGSQYGFDSAKAKQLLADAGYADGVGFPQVTFTMVNSDTNRLVGQFVQDQLKQNLGIDVEFDYVEGREYGRIFTQRLHQVVIQRWSADWPYPDNWLPQLFNSEARNNFAAYNNSAFDALMLKAAVETDNTIRLSLYGEGHKLMIDEAGIVPLYNSVTHVLIKPYVMNYIITGVDGFVKGDLNFHKVYIAGASTATVN